MVASITSRMPGQGPPAHQLSGRQRQDLSLAVLSGRRPVSRLAAGHQVSRKFCYQQVRKARAALDREFADADPVQPAEVLFYLPVTKPWIEQFVLAQTLIGHTSDRGVLELLDCLLGYRQMSLGTVHNLLGRAADRAAALNAQEGLSGIRVAALDEIYQANQPVLVGMDVASTYCFLLAQEPGCDATTWGVHLLDLSERQGLAMHHGIADGGLGLRGGMAQAWPGVPCHGDVFHPLRDMGRVVGCLRHRADRVARAVAQCQQKLDACPPGWSRKLDGRRGVSQKRLTAARAEQAQARQLYQDVDLLAQWLRQDVLALAGADLATRRELYDFIVAELQAREGLCPHQVTPLRTKLAGQKQQLLGFAQGLQEELDELARRHGVPGARVQAIARLQGTDPNGLRHWQQRRQLLRELGERLYPLEQQVKQVLAQTTRASSMVENLNGRLRCYFFLRRQLGQPYLHLLRFFLNHRPYRRSAHAQRVGRSPAQLLYGHEHPHWLEMLGYQRFTAN